LYLCSLISINYYGYKESQRRVQSYSINFSFKRKSEGNISTSSITIFPALNFLARLFAPYVKYKTFVLKNWQPPLKRKPSQHHHYDEYSDSRLLSLRSLSLSKCRSMADYVLDTNLMVIEPVEILLG